MKTNTYINGACCISTQDTFKATELLSIKSIVSGEVLNAIDPPYKEYIPPTMIRRMAKGVKMGVVATTEALKEAGNPPLDAILVGTGIGCLQDSEKFLKALLDNNEQHLTPTAFIQSTHNTVAGQIALQLQCKGLNFTYVNGAVSFESALLDAKMQMELGELSTALVGGVDEHSPHTLYLYDLIGLPLKSEGAGFFVLSDKQTDSTYATLVDVTLKNVVEPDEWQNFVDDFLQRNSCSYSDIDLVFTGEDCKRNYQKPTIAYKSLCGEYYTASAFGLWLACTFLKHQHIPATLVAGKPPKSLRNILLVNSFMGKDYSLTLIRR